MREFRFLYALALITIVIGTLGACQSHASKTEAQAPATVEIAKRTFSGSYLSGRFAQRQQDWATAQDYMNHVLSYDTNNSDMTQRTFLLSLGSGNFSKARALAERIAGKYENDELALIFLSCDALQREDFAAAITYLNQLPEEGFGQYTKPLLTAWALAGQGKNAEAQKLLSDVADPSDPTYHIHVGMMDEFASRMNEAEGHYRVAMNTGLNLHTAVLVSNFYDRYGMPEVSATIYEGLDKMYSFSPFANYVSKRDPHRALPSNALTASDGAALALFDLATLLYEKRAYESAQIYANIVQMLTPSSPFTRLMIGDIAALHEQYDKAVAEYNAIETTSPIYWLTRIRVSEVYEVSGRTDEAIRMLTSLSEDKAMRLQALASLGDIYRRTSQFENAVRAYDQALSDAPVTKEHWPIIYARGIARERLNNWNMAEKDLLQALSFQPDNPMILNFIAYSWARQGIHLDKALEYAKQAATLRPDDGYILDSYGWALFKSEQYKEAIVWLEQAVERIPDDSTLLDHLGDAYWQVGRKNEARYQWRQARELSRDASFKTFVEQKLHHGITLPSQVAQQDNDL